MKDVVYRKSLNELLKKQDNSSKPELSINPSKSFIVLFDGSNDHDRNQITKFSQKLKSKTKNVKLLSYVDSKGELMDFGMAVYNNKSINIYNFPKKHILRLLDSERFDIMFNLNIHDHKHLHVLACKAKADFKISLPTKYPHNFTMILKTKEKENLDKIINEIENCLMKLTVD